VSAAHAAPKYTADQARTREGVMRLVGAVYELHTGNVRFLE
jgi:hypothetical protein